MESLRKSIPGADPNLPSFIVGRMEQLGFRPTLTELARGVDAPISTIRENLNGQRPMKLDTALRLSRFLRVDLTALVQEAGLR